MTRGNDDVVCRPVGVIHSRFKGTVGVPIQTAGVPDEPGTLEIYPGYAAGLRDVQDFEFLILITHLHLADAQPLEVMPFLDDKTHGVFATRAPARPNRLGLSIVRLQAVDGRRLHFLGNDMVDGTPVLDIKPYVPAFDVRDTPRIGWFAGRLDAMPATRSDARMGKPRKR